MAFNDPIAELLTKIRNAKDARHRFVDVWRSNKKLAIVKILKEEGYVQDFKEGEEKVRVFLKYTKNREPVLHGLKRVSSPGLRKYVSVDKIPTVLGGMGITILSTSKGILEGNKAKEMKVGGELLCYIW